MNDSLNPTEHVEDELLAEYIDGRLDAEARAQVDQHLTNCDQCYAIFTMAAETAATLREQDAADSVVTDGARDRQSNLQRGPRRRVWRTAAMSASLVAVAALLIALSWPSLRAWYIQRRGGMPALVLAAESLRERPSDARLSGGFPHRPFPEFEAKRGDGAAKPSGSWQIEREVQREENQVSANAGADTLHRAGVAQLLLKSPQLAVDHLERAIATETGKATSLDAIHASNNWRLLVDLSAAYLARNKTSEHVNDRAAALEAAERAWRIARVPETAWNRAVALHANKLRDPERQAWQDYLALDATSAWANEARTRLAKLNASTLDDEWTRLNPALLAKLSTMPDGEVAALAKRFPSQVRTYGAGLLMAWIDREGKRAGSGRDHLAALAKVATALESVYGDAVMSEIVATLAAVERAGLATIAPMLTKGASPARIAEAADLLRPTSTRLSDLISLGAIKGFAEGRSYKEADALLQRLDAVDCGRHAWLCGRREGVRAFLTLAQGDSYRSRRHHVAAVQHYTALRDPVLLAKAYGYMAEADTTIGDHEAASEHLRRAAEYYETAGVRQTANYLYETADALSATGYTHAATAALTGMVTAASQASEPDALAVSLIKRAIATMRLGDTAAARDDLNQAERAAMRIKDAAIRARHLTDLRLGIGYVLSRAEPSLALSALNAAMETVDRAGHAFRKAEILAQRARVRLAGGDWRSAEADFAKALSVLQAERSTLPGRPEQLLFFEQAGSLFDDVIEELVRRKDAAAALSYAVMSNAPDASRAGTQQEGTSNRTSRVANGDAAVQYWQLNDKVIAFTVTPSSIEAAIIPVSRAYNDQLQYRCRAAFEKWGKARSCAEEMYDLFIRPIEGRIAGARNLGIVPHRSLYGIPFAALRDRKTGEYVATRHAVRVTRSVTSEQAVQPQPFRCTSALALVAAEGDAPLEFVRDDGRALRTVCPQVTVIEDAASPQVLSAALRNQTLIQYSGHAEGGTTVNDARLLLLPGDESASLPARSVHGLQLAGTELVVLAACETAVGAARNLAPSASMADAFLNGGARAVISTLWEVGDRSANEFLTAFYGNLPGRTISDAFALTQRSCIQNPSCEQAGAWASFQLSSVY